LQALNRAEDAWRVMETAMASEPKNVKTFGPDGAEFTSNNKDNTVSKGWLPKGWNDGSSAMPVNVQYTKLSDGPPGATAIRIAVTSPARSTGLLRGPRFIGKAGSKFTVEGMVRSTKRSYADLVVKCFYEPQDKIAQQTLNTTENWKPFSFTFTAPRDFAEELLLMVPTDGVIDIANVTISQK
jgi:hypothetical protein